MRIEMRVRVVNLNADEQNLWCRCSVPAGSIVEEFREFVLSRRVGVEDECAFYPPFHSGSAVTLRYFLSALAAKQCVEGEFRCLPGGGGFR